MSRLSFSNRILTRSAGEKYDKMFTNEQLTVFYGHGSSRSRVGYKNCIFQSKAMTKSSQADVAFTGTELAWAASNVASHISREDFNAYTDWRSTPPAITPERLRLESADIRYLSDVISKLNELRKETERDSEGVLQATKYSYDLACQLIIDGAIILARIKRPIPYAFVSSDYLGGVRVEWIRDDRALHLVIAAKTDLKSYIYYEHTEGFGSVPATAENLALWLKIIS